jgi:hypothetical protein
MTIAKKRNRIVPKFFNQLRREIMLEDFKNFEKCKNYSGNNHAESKPLLMN